MCDERSARGSGLTDSTWAKRNRARRETLVSLLVPRERLVAFVGPERAGCPLARPGQALKRHSASRGVMVGGLKTLFVGRSWTAFHYAF